MRLVKMVLERTERRSYAKLYPIRILLILSAVGFQIEGIQAQCIDDSSFTEEEPRCINSCNCSVPSHVFTDVVTRETLNLTFAKFEILETLQKYDTEVLQNVKSEVQHLKNDLYRQSENMERLIDLSENRAPSNRSMSDSGTNFGLDDNPFCSALANLMQNVTSSLAALSERVEAMEISVSSTIQLTISGQAETRTLMTQKFAELKSTTESSSNGLSNRIQAVERNMASNNASQAQMLQKVLNTSGSMNSKMDGFSSRLQSLERDINNINNACENLQCNIDIDALEQMCSHLDSGQGSTSTSTPSTQRSTAAASTTTSTRATARTATRATTTTRATTPSSSRQTIRLVGGSHYYEGRVEAYHGGRWGTICDDSFDVNDGKVICRMLGYWTGNVTVYPSAHFGQGSGPILLDDLRCNGNEASIFDCSHNWIGIENCGHGEDVSVSCAGNVRLVGGSSDAEGRVEIYHAGRWGTVCDDSFDVNDGKVICRMLGFHTENVAVFHGARYGQGRGPILFDNLACTGREASIFDCAHNGIGRHDCGHHEDVSVRCPIRVVRLVGGRRDNEGRVEVYHGGRWGTVCDDGFDVRDGKVICRMLGLSTSNVRVFDSAHYGAGTGPILLDDLGCSGYEDSIFDCRNRGSVGSHNCGHSEDVGVQC